MNKLLTRISMALVGIAMAVGVGVAAGVKPEARSVEATDPDPYYSFVIAKNTTNSNYTQTYDVEIDELSWNVPGNHFDDGELRLGGKNTTNTNRIITGKSAMGAKISKVVVNHNGVGNGKSSSITVNSFKIDVSSKSDFSDSLGTETKSNPSVASAGSLTFNAESSFWAKDAYYKFTMNYKITGSNNCYLKISSIDFYEYVPQGTLSVTYQANDKTSGTVPTDSRLYNAGDTVTVKSGGDLDKTNYVFDGWRISGESENVGATFTMPSTNVTLVAQWAAASNVVYHANNDTEEANVTRKAKTGSTYTVLTNTVTAFTAPANKEFAGWKLNAAGTGDFVGASFTLTENVDLYAVWTPKGGTVLKPYTVAEFISNYESIAGEDIYVTGFIVDWITYKTIDYALISDVKGNDTTVLEVFGASNTNVTFSGCNSSDYVVGSKIIAHGTAYYYANGDMYETKSSTVTAIFTEAFQDAQTFEDSYILNPKGTNIPYPASTPTGISGNDCLNTSVGGKGYFKDAMDAYALLSDDAKAEFGKNAAFANARERLIAWGKANGQTIEFDALTGAMSQSAKVSNYVASTETSSFTIVIILISTVSLVAIAGYFVIRRRKENN